MLRTRTTRELDEDMSAADIGLLTMLYDLMQRKDDDRAARAVNKGLWGDKNG